MADRVGQQLGNYQLVRLLGRGGFAEVYLGEHQRLRTQAAIKVLRTQLADEDVEGFLNEARMIAHLEHPYIVRVLDFDVAEGTPFLVMSYAPHGNLRQRHPKGVILPLNTIVSYVKQVTDALQYAHDEKLIHCDIKPENMLIGRRNDVLLSDFGIALISQSSQLQSTQEVIGTAAYMAPEQFQGKPRKASDQYALGVVVYEWLCGERPFAGNFTELFSQHMFVPPPPLREKVATVPLEVEQVVMTTLAKNPKDRFGSMRAFATALEQAYESLSNPTIVTPSSQLPIQSGPLISPSAPPLIAPSTLTNSTRLSVESGPISPPSQSIEQIYVSPSLGQSFPFEGKQVEATPVDTYTSPYESIELPYISQANIAPASPNPPSQISVDFNPKPVTFSHKLASSPASTYEPSILQPSKQGISRRVILVGLSCLGLAIVGSGITWQVFSQRSQVLQRTQGNQLPTPASSQGTEGNQLPTPASSQGTEGNQLPMPTAFQTATSREVGITLKYPSDWVQEAAQTSSDSNSFSVHPQSTQHLGITIYFQRFSTNVSSTIASTSKLNQSNITSFSSVQGVHNVQTITSPTSQRTIGGASWDEQDASFSNDGGTLFHFTTLSVKHNKMYYNITFYTPDVYYDEAMQKYFQPILDSFQFLL